MPSLGHMIVRKAKFCLWVVKLCFFLCFFFGVFCVCFSGIYGGSESRGNYYRKIPKFSDPKNCAVIYLKFKQRPNLREFRQKGANGIANSEDPDQTAPLGAV